MPDSIAHLENAEFEDSDQLHFRVLLYTTIQQA